MHINQNTNNIKLSSEFDAQFISNLETPYSESSICCFMSKMELKCLRDPIASRVTLVNIFNSANYHFLITYNEMYQFNIYLI